MEKGREFITELTVISLTIIIGLIALLLPNVSKGEAYIVWAVGALMISVTFTLKKEILSVLNERIEIYSLLQKINDDELRRMAINCIDECRNNLENLAQGSFTGGVSEIFDHGILRIKNINNSIQATHVVPTLSCLHIFNTQPSVINYYNANIEAIKRGVKIERIFIIDEEVFFDSDKNIVDIEALKIIKKQIDDGIDVTIALKKDIPESDLMEDFIIFDNSIVQIEKTGTANIYDGVTVTKIPKDIKLYQSKFRALRLNGHPPERIFNFDVLNEMNEKM